MCHKKAWCSKTSALAATDRGEEDGKVFEGFG